MFEQWIGLANIPADGRDFSFDDQEFWQQICQEFKDEYCPTGSFSAVLTITAQPDGYLIQGRLDGAVDASCHRCAEPAHVEVAHVFDNFEAFEDMDALEGEDSYLRNGDSGWELNIAGMLREEFLLALPEKILCADTCLGLCPQCGKNRNLEQCVCSNSDPLTPLGRALQGVKIKNN